jgi:hypothetical protein
MSVLNIRGDLSLIAWDGTEWSDPETQNGLSVMSDPKTYDPILLQCQQVSYYGSTLFVVGCDQGGSEDVWFSSRPLDPVETLFPAPSDWGILKAVDTVPRQISFLSSVADQENNIHSIWVQSGSVETAQGEPEIQYVRLNSDGPSKPSSIFQDWPGLPVDLSVAIDNQQRLMLSWVDELSGDILFSWANSDRAGIPSEWTTPVVLTSPASLNGSPDILIDASNRIVIAYAVTLNEARGIYFVHSSDQGKTWSLPIRVFDAVSANWDAVDEPKLALTSDGHLHVLFTRFSVLGGRKSEGLYYSRSTNGGTTWSVPEAISEQNVLWSEIIGDDQQRAHRLWQVKDRSATIVYHQVSRDNGVTWDAPVKLSSMDGMVSVPALIMTGSGELHLLQLFTRDVPFLQEWDWAGERWRTLKARGLNVRDQSIPVSINAAITTEGVLSTLLLFDRNDLLDGHSSQLLNVDRKLAILGKAQFNSTVVMIAPEVISDPMNSIDLQPTATRAPSLADLGSPPSSNKNTIGFVLVLVVITALVIFSLPGRRKK